jgi:hypothetical protein
MSVFKYCELRFGVHDAWNPDSPMEKRYAPTETELNGCMGEDQQFPFTAGIVVDFDLARADGRGFLEGSFNIRTEGLRG